MGCQQHLRTIRTSFRSADASTIRRRLLPLGLIRRVLSWCWRSAKASVSDAYSFDVVHRLRERGYAGRIIAECVDDRNRERLSRAGASAVVRPLRGYPEMIVRAIVAPGSERIVEQMFSSEGDECLRFDVRVQDVLWAEVAAALIGADYGTPLGYADADGGLHINPAPNEPTRAQALFLLVDERQRVCRDAVQRLVDELRAKQ